MQIDHRELNSVPPETLQAFFTRKGVNFQIVNLVLGDYLWLARRKVLKGDGCEHKVSEHRLRMTNGNLTRR